MPKTMITISTTSLSLIGWLSPVNAASDIDQGGHERVLAGLTSSSKLRWGHMSHVFSHVFYSHGSSFSVLTCVYFSRRLNRSALDLGMFAGSFQLRNSFLFWAFLSSGISLPTEKAQLTREKKEIVSSYVGLLFISGEGRELFFA